MAARQSGNLLKTFPLQGGEDFVSSILNVPDGAARLLYNYELDYNAGYSRIAGYRKLVNTDLPGRGPVRGLVVFNNMTYLFQDVDNSPAEDADEGGMWVATPATYRIGSEADNDPEYLWGVNIVLTDGAWTRVTDLNQPLVDPLDDDEVPVPLATPLAPGGYYQFVESNFSATVSDFGIFLGRWSTLVVNCVNNEQVFNYGDTIQDDTDAFGGGIDRYWVCKSAYAVGNCNGILEIDNWVMLTREAASINNSHDVSGSSGYLYGTDGKNHSFQFNPGGGATVEGQYIQIDAGYDNDTPHHCESAGNRLILGFRAGEVAMSSHLSPMDFDAVNGAGSVGVQDWLTGLVAGPEGVLFVFCKDKSYLLTGADGALSNAVMEKHSRDVGAYPYTASALAGRTFFYDTWGLTEFEVTQKYGDVISNSISSKIQFVLKDHQPVISVVSRDRAQYKLWFRTPNEDYSSTLLNTTIVMGESIGFAHSVYPFTISHAATGEVNELAIDGSWNFSSSKLNHVAGVKLAPDTEGGDETYQVFQMDIGNSFDGAEYTSYMALPFNYLGSPHRVKKFRKMILSLDNKSPTSLTYSVDFSSGAHNKAKETGEIELDPTGSRWQQGYWNNFYWGGGETGHMEGYINGHGENLSVTITNTSASEEPHTLKDITFVYQYMRIEH